MSKTKLDNITRSALWRVHGHRCFYCQQPIYWAELHIDHIIPESTIIDNSFKTEYGLSDEFDTNDFSNLVPAHSSCNLKKGDILLSKQALFYYLTLTMDKKSLVEKTINSEKAIKNRGLLLSKVASALDCHLISPEEINDIIEDAQKNEWNPNRIILPKELEYIEDAFDIFYLKKDSSELYNKTMPAKIELVNDLDSKKEVSTLGEWISLTKQGYYPLSTYAIKLSSYYTFLENLVEIANKAEMPKVSFISEPWIGLEDFDYLSPSIINAFDVEESLNVYIQEQVSIGELMRRGIVKRNKNDNFHVALEYGGNEIFLSEHFRADLNNDGVEDIFVRGYVQAIGGTLGFGFTTILTRYSSKHLIEQVVYD